MKKACLVVMAPYTNGEIFNRQNQRLNRDNCLAFFHDLQSEFLKAGVDLNTQDINRPEECDFIIYNEMPAQCPAGKDIDKSYLLLFESELIRPDNWSMQSHAKFKKIFTWHDKYVDRKKYFKMNFTHGDSISFLKYSEKSKFCTLIAGNKRVSHPLELYSHRVKAIRWFEENHPELFEFFGVGWSQYTFKGPKVIRAFNRVPFLRTLLAEKWPSYRGPVENKNLTLRQFKFSICFENAKDIPGYITEKIFDSLSAGCIPVYWGAPNITDYVPESCFVDMRKFATFEELFSFLRQMSSDDYNRRLEEISAYLASEKHLPFMPKLAAASVASEVLNGEA